MKAARGESGATRAEPRRASRTRSVLGEIRLDRRFGLILALFLLLVGGIVGYNALAMARQRGAALIVNVAARQQALSERYIKDVILRAEGYRSDPGEDAKALLDNADALLNGGDVEAVQGADATVHIAPASSDPRVSAKLEEERRLLRGLIDAGARVLALQPGEPGFDDRLLGLRVVGAQLSSISNDAVGQMTRDAEAEFGHLVAVGIGLGLLGAVAAVAMGLLLRRAGAQQSAHFRSLVQNASDLITVVDGDGKIRFQSPSVERVLGFRQEDLIGTNCLDLVDPNDQTRLRTLLADVSEEPGRTSDIECRVTHADGSWRHVESIVTNLTADPTVRGLVFNTRDVTERRTLEDQLAHQAFHDSLTGLANRALFRDRVGHALTRAARHREYLAVLLLDLDGFKTVNDSLGHDAGDELLVAVTDRIRACARTSDTVARLGGDEFAVLLEDEVGEADAVAVAGRLLAGLAAPFAVRKREVFIGASVGIALCALGLGDTDEVIRNADTAMYAAKAAGRGRYEMFRPDMHERAVRHLEVRGDLQRALSRGEFALRYQPIVDLESGVAEGMEALIRWNHPRRGQLAPMEFIPTAEETGLIVPIGRWVLREACRQAAEWRAGHPRAADLWVSVNLSVRQLAEPDLVHQVREALEDTGLDPNALILELTEGSLMQDVNETTIKLEGLKELGVRLAIDDFGTGSSSLGYLRRFPVDVLKIDKSFVDDVTNEGSHGSALVEAIVELAKTLRLETVAEGIELRDQLAELQSAGCRSGQGFLFARPLETAAMEAFLRQEPDAPSAVA